MSLSYKCDPTVSCCVSHPEPAATMIGIETLAQVILDANQGLTDSSGGMLDIASLTTLLKDTTAGAKLLKDLGYAGSYYTKVSKTGSTVVILRGHAGLRSILTGTKYLDTHRKVISMGIGGAAAKAAARSNLIIAFVIYVPLETAEYFMSDEKTLSDLLAGISVKVGIAALSLAAGALFAAGIAAVSTVAIPAAAIVGGTIIVGLAVGAGLTAMSDALGLEDKLSAALSWTAEAFHAGLITMNQIAIDAHVTMKQKIENMDRKINKGVYEFERELIWHISPQYFHLKYRR